ncbi:MAG: hypothetical protein OEU68_03790 [Nitrospira sp.]|nr:hypothetical protein [Nitrospira sp.]MDH4244354.1 hypothetical protein [Nitrospira sp.]MDH4354854.1 hypothetical protein [Nitrospira sp.]MDH5317072.1 hypothetical protein [Nitrospira sp.]
MLPQKLPVLVLVIVVWGMICVSHGLAEEVPASKRVKIDLTLGTWISVGDTRWSHDASTSFPLGNPTSRLIYSDHSANVVEFSAKLSVGPRFFGRLNVGGAGIGGGRLIDDDFLSPDRGSPSSRTHSDIDGGSLWYVNADMGTRLTNFPNGRGTFDGFVGFQYWRQKHEAYGVRQVHCSAAGTTVDLDPFTPGVDPLCAPGGVPVSNAVLVISNTSTWYSLRTGVQGEYHLTRWLSVHGSAVLKPINLFTNEDTHHLRVVTGELQDPSFTMVGVGFGADADIGAKVNVTKYLAVQVGYRVWWNRMIDGTWEGHPANGPSVSFPLVEMQSLRHGLTAGLTLSF